jgi:hypothetical protein
VRQSEMGRLKCGYRGDASLPQHRSMGQGIRAEQLPEGEEPEAPANCDPCPSCRGRGRKFVTLRRLVGAAGGASEDELLKRTRTECLSCAGTGKASA